MSRIPTTPTAKPAGTTTAKPATATTGAKPAAQQATPVTPSATSGTVPAERIAKRAYEKWLKRGCSHGNDVQDWIEAEKEVMAEMKGTAASGTTRR